MKVSDVVNVFEDMGIELSDHQANQFITYYKLLVSWNEKMNLTAITASEEVLIKHFADSVIASKVVNFHDWNSLIDVGTGAGFPGIPLKIVYPHLKVTLMDALNKRIGFLDEVINTLGLEGIQAIHGRAEDMARTDMREAYDLCVSRAVSQLNVLSEYCLPFIRIDGLFISYKGMKTNDELKESTKAIGLLGGVVQEVTDQVKLTEEINRGFVVVRKETTTDSKYPRRAGKPQKKPL